MTKWNYYVNDFEFEWPDGDGGYTYLKANFQVNACRYLFGDDADGNRGVYVTERELVNIEVKDDTGNPIELKPGMEEHLADRVREEGSDLE
jgi:hypothetical protein